MHAKWRTMVALVPLIIAIVMSWWWFFTLLFIWQIIISLQTEKVEYVEEITKAAHPYLYWLIISIWIFLAVYSLTYY